MKVLKTLVKKSNKARETWWIEIAPSSTTTEKNKTVT